MLQQPPPSRPGDGQHGADRAAALLQVGAILDLIAPRAAPDIDRAHALRQGELLGCPPSGREIITTGRWHYGFHDAAHGHDDRAAGRA